MSEHDENVEKGELNNLPKKPGNDEQKYYPGFDSEGNYTLNPGDPSYNVFCDPRSAFFGLPPNWSATGAAPIPTVRCTATIKETGEPCKARALRGLGLDGAKAVCISHGGRLPNVKAKADAVTQAARMALMDHVPDAVKTLAHLMNSEMTADAVRLKASTEILDRVGVNSKQEIDVSIEHSRKPSDIIAEKLAEMASSMGVDDSGEIVDEGEQTNDDESNEN